MILHAWRVNQSGKFYIKKKWIRDEDFTSFGSESYQKILPYTRVNRVEWFNITWEWTNHEDFTLSESESVCGNLHGPSEPDFGNLHGPWVNRILGICMELEWIRRKILHYPRVNHPKWFYIKREWTITTNFTASKSEPYRGILQCRAVFDLVYYF